ncbi:uncharacterized protein [Clytia hemisphaerica]|uniref:uncharacterized protein n=1 Tax=Clytia hemisphaerica TaxID=252671 RepID=UPI0034D76854
MEIPNGYSMPDQKRVSSDNSICSFSKEPEVSSSKPRQPVLRHVLRPILVTMKIFGLYYNDSSGLKEMGVNKWSIVFWKYYAFLINLIIVGLLTRTITGLWYVGNSNGYYMIGVFIVFTLKSTGQALYILYLCHREILWNFITDLEDFLNKITTCQCPIVESHFVRKMRIWLSAFGVVILLCTVTNVIVMFYPNNELQDFREMSILPITSTEPIYYALKVITDLILLGGWFLPCALAGTLIQTLHYTFNEYYRYLEIQSKKGICVKAHVKDIRKKFLDLSSLCSKLDSIVSVLLMISYLGDLCLVCVILRLGVYTFHGLYGKLCIFSWIIAPAFTLLFLSSKASQLYDKGQEMYAIVQFFNTDAATLPIKMEVGNN